MSKNLSQQVVLDRRGFVAATFATVAGLGLAGCSDTSAEADKGSAAGSSKSSNDTEASTTLDAKAFDKLTFTMKGDANIVAVDNGNIASDELHIGKTKLEKSIQRHLFQGSALVILRAGDKPGKIERSVAGEKMKAKKLVLNTK